MASLAMLGNDLYSGKRSFGFITYRKRWLAIGAAMVVAALLILGFKGLNPGIAFRGGSEFRIENVTTTDSQPVVDALQEVGISEIPRVSTLGTGALRIQTQTLDSDQLEQVREALAEAYGSDEITSTVIGPSWGADVTKKAIQGMVIFLVLVALVMAVYFRSWTMSLAALVALLHDLVVTVGIYALVGFEVTPASVIGFLTILSYSLYDTVVVFDKVRENTAGILNQKHITYAQAANLAVNQMLIRAINTSVVGVLPVAAILFVGTSLGAGTLRDIALALFVGMIVSTVSSIFVASPLETVLRERTGKYKEHTETVLQRRAANIDSVAGDATAAAAMGEVVVAGQHLGQAAQPHRKKRSK